MRTFRDRVPYSAIVDRPVQPLPGGARVAVWTIVNVEEWSPERAMPRTVLPPPFGQPLLPDLPNWAWHEYGMRVGFWRFEELLKGMGIRATLAINGNVCASYPRVAKAALDAGWEFMGHGHVQRPMHHVEDQKAAIRQTIEAIEKYGTQFPLSKSYVSFVLYRALEERLFQMYGNPIVVTKNSTLGHIGVIPCVVRDEDAVIIDHQAHWSMHNACQQAALWRFF